MSLCSSLPLSLSSTNYNNHEQYGSAEAVSLHLSNLKDFALAAKLFFSDFQRIGVNVWARKDVYDQGPQFRALIGVPGGLNGDYGPLLEDANLHGMELLDGEGSDEDTFEDNAVYVYDTGEGEKGTFQQAEGGWGASEASAGIVVSYMDRRYVAIMLL